MLPLLQDKLDEEVKTLQAVLDRTRKENKECAISIAKLMASEKSSKEKCDRLEQELLEVQREAEHYVDKIEVKELSQVGHFKSCGIKCELAS